MVELEQDNKWVFKLLFVINDTSICKTNALKFVPSLTSLNSFGLLKNGGKLYHSYISFHKKEKKIISFTSESFSNMGPIPWPKWPRLKVGPQKQLNIILTKGSCILCNEGSKNFFYFYFYFLGDH